MNSDTPIIIAGMHRSGTSLLARFIHHSGIDLGNRFVGARLSNPYGCYEDIEILDFHQAILLRELGHSMWVTRLPTLTLATYPHTILAASSNKMAEGTYAELKQDRKRLSQAFLRTNAFLVRSWCSPCSIKVTVADLFFAFGMPEQVVRAKLAQLVVLVAGLFLLGSRFGISGVALAANLMLLLGIAMLLLQARTYVDISLVRLLAVPSLALAVGLALGLGIFELSGLSSPSWWSGVIEVMTFSTVYGLVSLVLERRQVTEAYYILSNYFIQPPRQVRSALAHGEE